jgi:hypothetical protein
MDGPNEHASPGWRARQFWHGDRALSSLLPSSSEGLVDHQNIDGALVFEKMEPLGPDRMEVENEDELFDTGDRHFLALQQEMQNENRKFFEDDRDGSMEMDAEI